ncbi:MAG: DEAD/DEAH box helicase [Armatimonadetes bacterium]|nr:DEAD/DEAH box helicase [Armatimonadota bacterium]
MKFSSFPLDDRLQRAVAAVGYSKATPVQEAAIPPALEGRDLIGTAQTGTGKTAAFVLPILQSLLTTPARRKGVRALIVTPTRELAEQIHEAVRELGRFTKIRSATVYGGVGFEPQTRALRNGTEIIIACPGRLLDHLGRGNADLRGAEIVVLDEADRMLDMGFLPDVRRIVSQTPRERQTMLFSATFAPELSRLAADILRHPQRIEIGVSAPADTVEHTLCPVDQREKTALLLRLLEETDTGSVLVFTRTKHRADRLAAQVKRSGYRTAVLHSNRTQNQRQQALDGFRSGRYELLVATDIAARGLDIATVSHVINYDMPGTVDDYIHRIGRTGRAERRGEALTLVTADDCATVRDIERVLGGAIGVRRVEGFDYGMPTVPIANGASRGPRTPTSYRSRPKGPSYGGRKSNRRHPAAGLQLARTPMATG